MQQQPATLQQRIEANKTKTKFCSATLTHPHKTITAATNPTTNAQAGLPATTTLAPADSPPPL
jgi:hypothetical protein